MISRDTNFVATGIFSIVAACFSFLVGLFGLLWYLRPPFIYSGFIIFSPNRDPAFLVMGLLGSLGFALGLDAGVFAFKGSHHSAVVACLLVLIVGPFVPFLMGLLNQAGVSCFYPQCNNGSISTALGVLVIPGSPIMILSALALLFLTLKKNEIANSRGDAQSSLLEDSSLATLIENLTGRVRDSLLVSKRTTLRTAGICSFVAASFTLLIAYVGFYSYLNPELNFSGFPPVSDPVFLILGLLGMLGFALGIAAGIFTLKRSHHSLILAGLLIMILAPIIPYIISWLSTLPIAAGDRCPLCSIDPRDILGDILYILGTPTIILSALALLFTNLRKNEFLDEHKTQSSPQKFSSNTFGPADSLPPARE